MCLHFVTLQKQQQQQQEEYKKLEKNDSSIAHCLFVLVKLQQAGNNNSNIPTGHASNMARHASNIDSSVAVFSQQQGRAKKKKTVAEINVANLQVLPRPQTLLNAASLPPLLTSDHSRLVARPFCF